MKRLILLSLIASFIVLVSAVTVANLNVVNLLLADVVGNSSSSDSKSGGSGSSFDEGELGDAPYNPTVDESQDLMQSLQSGLLTNGSVGSGKLNLLWLLQNAKEVNTSSYAYQLLEAYSNLETGKYNDLSIHVTAEALAGSHFNESTQGSFVVPQVSPFAKEQSSSILGKTINGRVVTLENATREDVSRPSGSSAVWLDQNSDGFPDGPFQIEEGRTEYGRASKTSTKSTYDLYSFPDSMNVVDYKYYKIGKALQDAGYTYDPRALAALFALAHNRGESGVGRMLFGMPYTANSGTAREIGYHNYIKQQTLDTLSPERLKIALDYTTQVIKWYDAANLPVESIVGNVDATRALGILLVLSNGGFINSNLSEQTKSGIGKLPDSVVGKLFPGYDSESVIPLINTTKVMKPWDVLGKSKSEYDRIYGSAVISSNYEEVYRYHLNYYNTVFYIDKNVTSDIYKAGENVVVRAIEGIASGYMLDASVIGTYVIVKTALEAGIKSLKNGTIVDATNPESIYEKMVQTKQDTFNPASSASGNYQLFLEGLGLAGKLSVTQQAQIEAMYKVSGGKYSQGKSQGYSCERGEYMKDRDSRCLDCSAITMIGLYINPDLKPSKFSYTGAFARGSLFVSQGKTKPVNGVQYDVLTVQLDKNGNPMKPSTKVNQVQKRKQNDWRHYLQTGDIYNTMTKSHVITYLGHNDTDKRMVLTQDVSKVSAKFSVIEPDRHFSMESSGHSLKVGDDKHGLHPIYNDDAGRAYYFAVRPVYNVR